MRKDTSIHDTAIFIMVATNIGKKRWNLEFKNLENLDETHA